MSTDVLDDVLGERLVAYHHDSETKHLALKFESGTILRHVGGQSKPVSSEDYGITDVMDESYEWIEVDDDD